VRRIGADKWDQFRSSNMSGFKPTQSFMNNFINVLTSMKKGEYIFNYMSDNAYFAFRASDGHINYSSLDGSKMEASHNQALGKMYAKMWTSAW
jgi:hypothetical protein